MSVQAIQRNIVFILLQLPFTDLVRFSFCNLCFQVVIFGGHIDSWDVGVGAMDDGGGVVISWQVGSQHLVIRGIFIRAKDEIHVYVDHL